MEPAVHQLIEAIHRAPQQGVLAVTGGGAGAAAWLLTVPGGSRTVLEVVVPYHEAALCDFLGRRPAQFCSAETSRALAERACQRARWLAPGAAVVGVGCTAGLATDRPRRGDHRCHIAVHASERIVAYSLTLTKGARDRQAEETVVDRLLLNALAEAFNISERLDPLLLPGETIQVETRPAADPLSALLRGEVPAVCAEMDGRLCTTSAQPAALLAGSFNPVHDGHRDLAQTAARTLGQAVAFELSAANVDKPPLEREEIRRRLRQFTWRAPVWVTRAPTFREKAALFAGAVFVVGADTAERLVAPRYYGDREAAMNEALTQIREHGCRFLVAGRFNPEGRFIGLDDLVIPSAHAELFQGIPKEEFCSTHSSTALRSHGVASPAEDE